MCCFCSPARQSDLLYGSSEFGSTAARRALPYTFTGTYSTSCLTCRARPLLGEVELAAARMSIRSCVRKAHGCALCRGIHASQPTKRQKHRPQRYAAQSPTCPPRLAASWAPQQRTSPRHSLYHTGDSSIPYTWMPYRLDRWMTRPGAPPSSSSSRPTVPAAASSPAPCLSSSRQLPRDPSQTPQHQAQLPHPPTTSSFCVPSQTQAAAQQSPWRASPPTSPQMPPWTTPPPSPAP